jgi:hypothetical protein
MRRALVRLHVPLAEFGSGPREAWVDVDERLTQRVANGLMSVLYVEPDPNEEPPPQDPPPEE